MFFFRSIFELSKSNEIMNQLYPLKFAPILKYRIWGGNKLSESFFKNSNSQIIGESWEISGLNGDESLVVNGHLESNNLAELMEVYMGELVGDDIFDKYGENFPLLIKLIDAQDNLSIQVHPDDKLAEERGLGFGKTEMWYILDAEPDSYLTLGFKEDITKEDYLNALYDGEVEKLLNKVKVEKGDCFYIPAGLVHAIGKGIVIAEIQQSSDTTYRIYDYDRVDADGNQRELHIEESLEAIRFEKYIESDRKNFKLLNKSQQLVACDYFTTNKIVFDHSMRLDYSDLDTFKVFMCLDGDVIIETEGNAQLALSKGETCLIPASINDVLLHPRTEATILEVYLD